MKYLIVALLIFLSSCAKGILVGQEDTEIPLHTKVKSFETVQTEKFNSIIIESIDTGEEWPKSPALVAFMILGGDEETRLYHFKQEANSIENPDMVNSILMRDGFMDDSVRGDWHKITLKREADGTWRAVEIHRAFRCWRTNSNIFSSDLCP